MELLSRAQLLSNAVLTPGLTRPQAPRRSHQPPTSTSAAAAASPAALVPDLPIPPITAALGRGLSVGAARRHQRRRHAARQPPQLPRRQRQRFALLRQRHVLGHERDAPGGVAAATGAAGASCLGIITVPTIGTIAISVSIAGIVVAGGRALALLNPLANLLTGQGVRAGSGSGVMSGSRAVCPLCT